MKHLGLFGLSDHWKGLSANGDPLEALADSAYRSKTNEI